MSEHDLLSWVIPAFAAVLSAIGLGIFNQLKKLTTSVQKLSVNMAVIAERVNHHERRIGFLEKRRSLVLKEEG